MQSESIGDQRVLHNQRGAGEDINGAVLLSWGWMKQCIKWNTACVCLYCSMCGMIFAGGRYSNYHNNEDITVKKELVVR